MIFFRSTICSNSCLWNSTNSLHARFSTFLCSLGSAELAAVGVSGAVFNLVSKLFNVPLLNITTSFVAEEQASLMKAIDDYGQTARGILLP